MLAELRHLARLARELARRRTATAVTIIAGDDNLTEVFTLGAKDMRHAELVLYHALRQLPPLASNRVDFTAGDDFGEAARHLAIGLARLWPRFPIVVTRVQIGPPAALVSVQIELDDFEVARATIAQRRPIGEDLARQVQ